MGKRIYCKECKCSDIYGLSGEGLCRTCYRKKYHISVKRGSGMGRINWNGKGRSRIK